jgi:membrane protein YqaA with SNARE-associated domain
MTQWVETLGLTGLFISAFVSSTLAPGGSEAVIAYLAGSSQFTDGQLIGTATLGNTLGALTTWFLGSLVARRYAPDAMLSTRRARAVAYVQRWGWPLLLLSWLPIVGDGFCFAAGWLRLPFWHSLLAIAVGKALRYAAILWASHSVASAL